jgi:nucleoside-diphosphate-sugar epimerase
MKIAIFGATSQIAKDLIKSISGYGEHQLYLYTRYPVALKDNAAEDKKKVVVHLGDYESFDYNKKIDAIINFVGVGDPAKAIELGASIYDITRHYDQIAISYVQRNKDCRYIFLSSGAVYGTDFDRPVNFDSKAVIDINKITSNNWYGTAKLYAECIHRSNESLPIVDIRMFNYFSACQDPNAKFMISDAIRSIRDCKIMKTSGQNIFRDYLHPVDFYSLIESILKSAPNNDVVDAYSCSPVSKFELLDRMKKVFGLEYEIVDEAAGINSTGNKLNYYSLNHKASEYGYTPKYSSIEGVILEAKKIFN